MKAKEPETPGKILKQGYEKGREELEEEISSGEHYLAFPIYDRIEMRDLFAQGLGPALIAKLFGTSLKVVRRILSMKEKLSKEREVQIAQTFFRTGALLRRILDQVTDEKIKGASLSQQLISVGILSDKMLQARKALDGDAPDRVEVGIHSFGDRAALLNAVREKMDQLRPVLAQYEVVAEGSTGSPEDVGPTALPAPAPPQQTDLFETKEPA